MLRALARIHAEELARHSKQAAKKRGETAKLHTGTFVQRFGSSLNLHVHLHTCVLDGVYVEGEDGEAPRFAGNSAESRGALRPHRAGGAASDVASKGRVREGGRPRLERHARPHLRGGARPARHAAGHVENVKDDTGESEGLAEPTPLSKTKPSRVMASTCTQASPSPPTMISAESAYGLRPFSLSRFRVLRDGRISYRVKKSSRRTSR